MFKNGSVIYFTYNQAYYYDAPLDHSPVGFFDSLQSATIIVCSQIDPACDATMYLCLTYSGSLYWFHEKEFLRGLMRIAKFIPGSVWLYSHVNAIASSGRIENFNDEAVIVVGEMLDRDGNTMLICICSNGSVRVVLAANVEFA